MERKYKTKQRESIIAYLKDNKEKHVTAEEIMEYFKSLCTPIGKSTVYRCLDSLVNENLVRKYVITEKDGACFQYVDNNEECTNHYHLKCTKCGKLVHLECEDIEELQEHMLTHHNFKIDICKTVLYGECGDCMKRSNK